MLRFLLAGFLSLAVAGCAHKQWSDPLIDLPLEASKAEIITNLAKYESCGNTLAADLALFYQDPFGQKALEGYLEFSLPKSYKFIVSNPFGQPLLAIAGNGKTFEVILTQETQYISGSLESYGLRSKLPLQFMKGDWGAWLMARCHYKPAEIDEIREDEQHRGLWVFWRSKEPNQPWEAVLFERESGNIIERQLLDHKNSKIATIRYDQWQTMTETGCRQPLSVIVSDLDYGAGLELKLKDVELRTEQNSYDLTPPSSYYKQYLP